jgi:enamine deaminase RidA (YjgF/YER057c/UK114 family)
MNVDRHARAVVPPSMEFAAGRFQYSPGLIVPAGRLLLVSGQVGRDERGVVVADAEEQFVQAFENLRQIVEEAGATLADVVEITTFHTAMADLPLFAEVKSRYLTTEPYPAWTGIGTTELALPGLRVEIRATVALPPAD